MRISARIYSFASLFFSSLLSVGLGLILFMSLATPVSAQTDYVTADASQGQHTRAQIVVIDVLSAITCQLVGIDPVDPKQPCMGVDPVTKQVGSVPNDSGTPQVGGALGAVTNMISVMYTPTVSTSQYVNYLSSNFGIVKPAHAIGATGTENCSTSPFGYGFCGLQPIFQLWVAARDFAYALLVIGFVALGIGIMIRFKVDPRTVMSLQNQIPRVIIAILLITFSYAIAGIMIDVMWTVTYAGINVIASSSTKNVMIDCEPPTPEPIQKAASQLILNNPLSFMDNIFLDDCNGATSGAVDLAGKVSNSFGDVVTYVINTTLGIEDADCGITNWDGCIASFFNFITSNIAQLIIIVALLVAMFRLWFELVKTYVTLLIAIILGPIWIVMGLVPGRPMGFEKWLRVVFANLAAFPAVGFIIVFARVMVDTVGETTNPDATFVPPLIGNPSIEAFSILIAFGALMIAPTIPALIKEKMKATGAGKYGQHITAGLATATGAVTAPFTKTYAHLDRVNSKTGNPQGFLAVKKAKFQHAALSRMGGIGASVLKNKYDGGYNPVQEARDAAAAAEAAKKKKTS